MNIQIVMPKGRTSYAPPNSFVERLLIDAAGEGRGALQAHINRVIDLMWQDFGYTEDNPNKIAILAEYGDTTVSGVITYAITRYTGNEQIVRSNDDSA